MKLKKEPIEIKDDLIIMNNVNRLEVIYEQGRSYIKWDDNNYVKLSLQDDGKTLKIFIFKKIL